MHACMHMAGIYACIHECMMHACMRSRLLIITAGPIRKLCAGGEVKRGDVCYGMLRAAACVHESAPRQRNEKNKFVFNGSNRPPMAGQVSEVEETLKRCPLKPENKEESGVRQSCSHTIYFLSSPQAGDAFWLQWVSYCRWAWPSDPKLARPRPCSAVFRPDHDFGDHPAPAELEFMLITLLLRLSPMQQRVTVSITMFACTGEKDP